MHDCRKHDAAALALGRRSWESRILSLQRLHSSANALKSAETEAGTNSVVYATAAEGSATDDADAEDRDLVIDPLPASRAGVGAVQCSSMR